MDVYKLFVTLAVLAGAVAWWRQQRAQPLVAYLAFMCAVVLPGQMVANVFAAFEHTSFTLSDVLLGRYGANILGGVIGGIAMTWLLLMLPFLRKRFGTLVHVLDQAACFVPLSMAIGRLGCFAAGDGCYGPPTNLPWGIAFPHGTVPTTVRVHPTMLYDALFLFAYFVIVSYRFRGRFTSLRAGLPSAYFLLLYGCERFLSEFLRLNPKYDGLSQAQWLSLVMVLAGSAMLIVLNRRRTPGHRTLLNEQEVTPSMPFS